jgi:dTDP-4-amino-4,6-dideoxygalactose transaminase
MVLTMNNLNSLAIMGGQPSFSEKLHVNLPIIGNREVFLKHVNSLLERVQLTNNGILVQELSKKLAEFLHVKHCVLTNNGTSAMSLLIKALDLHGEVILPSFTFISTAHTLLWQGITPIFCDIDPKTWNIDCSHCESLITNKTTAIVATHLWGRHCNIEQLQDIAEKHKIHILFDSAHAFGCTSKGEMIGQFGTAEVFSFHATKVFQTFEGGAITTNDSELAQKLEEMRNFGFTGFDKVNRLGINSKMPEICAAMGLANLDSIKNILQTNKNVYENFQTYLKNLDGIKLLEYDPSESNNYHYIVLEVDEEKIGLTRDEILEILQKENIIARRYFYPGNHKMEPYNSMYPEVDAKLPNTNSIASKVLLLPGGNGISEEEIKKISSLLELILKNSEILHKQLKLKSNND